MRFVRQREKRPAETTQRTDDKRIGVKPADRPLSDRDALRAEETFAAHICRRRRFRCAVAIKPLSPPGPLDPKCGRLTLCEKTFRPDRRVGGFLR